MTYREFLDKVKEYLDKHGKSGAVFVAQYSKWLDIFYTGHEQAYADLVKDERFLLEAGIVTAEEIEARRVARSEKARMTRKKNEEQKDV